MVMININVGDDDVMKNVRFVLFKLSLFLTSLQVDYHYHHNKHQQRCHNGNRIESYFFSLL